MIKSTANVNSTLDKISSAIAAAKRAGIEIGTGFKDDVFCCISLEQNINKAIDLTAQNANVKLNALLKHIYAVIPSNTALKEAS
jgi:hypothetical protein